MPYRALGAPVGTILDYGGLSAPPGWLLCDGTVQKKAAYAALFAVISTTFNVGGEAGDEFRLPMCCGRTRIGKGVCDDGVGTTFNVGQKVGIEKASLSEDELASHHHGQNVPSTVWSSDSEGQYELASGIGTKLVSLGMDTVPAGSSVAVSRMQPSLVCTAIIKA
jgi:microcystin-dependent protein